MCLSDNILTAEPADDNVYTWMSVDGPYFFEHAAGVGGRLWMSIIEVWVGIPPPQPSLLTAPKPRFKGFPLIFLSVTLTAEDGKCCLSCHFPLSSVLVKISPVPILRYGGSAYSLEQFGHPLQRS